MSTNPSKDRTGLCTFTFDDGRHCAMLQTDNESGLCYFHAQKEEQRLKTELAGLKVGRFLNAEVHTACDLNSAFAMLFRCTLQGYISTKSANALTKLGHLMLKTHLIAKEEYLSAYDAEWPDVVADSTVFHPKRGFVEDAAELPTFESESSVEQPKAPEKPETVLQTDKPEEVAEVPEAQEVQGMNSINTALAADQSDHHRSTVDNSADNSAPDDSAHDSPAEPDSSNDEAILAMKELRRLIHKYA
jgi:hypothetical protein